MELHFWSNLPWNFSYLTWIFVLPLAAFTTPGQKRQAPDILSKYSLRHLVEETEAEATTRKLVELDKKLESYHNAGAISGNGGVTDDDPDVVSFTKKSKVDI